MKKFQPKANLNSQSHARTTLRLNFRDYQNRRKLRKFWGINLYAILKSSSKFRRYWFNSFEIMPLWISGCLICILVGKRKNTVYSNIPEMMKIHVCKDKILNKNCYKIKRKLVRSFWNEVPYTRVEQGTYSIESQTLPWNRDRYHKTVTRSSLTVWAGHRFYRIDLYTA